MGFEPFAITYLSFVFGELRQAWYHLDGFKCFLDWLRSFFFEPWVYESLERVSVHKTLAKSWRQRYQLVVNQFTLRFSVQPHWRISCCFWMENLSRCYLRSGYLSIARGSQTSSVFEFVDSGVPPFKSGSYTFLEPVNYHKAVAISLDDVFLDLDRADDSMQGFIWMVHFVTWGPNKSVQSSFRIFKRLKPWSRR